MSRVRTALAAFLSAIFFVILPAYADGNFTPRSASITVVAIASDVHAVVLRNARGELKRYAVGSTIVDSAWRIARITGNQVTLEFSQRLNGSALDIRLHESESADLTAEGEKIVQMQSVHAVPTRTNLRASKPKTRTSH